MASFEQRGKTWRVRYRDGSTNCSQGGFETLRDAKAWWRAREAERERGVRHDRELTLSHLVNRYLAQHEASEARIERLRYSLRHATSAMGHVRVVDLTRDDIMHWRKTLQSDTLRFMATAALKQVLDYATHDLKAIASSPAKRVRNPDPGPTEEYQPFKDWAEVLRVDAEMPEHYRGWLVFLVGTGLRPQEWPKLKWEHVDLASGVLRLPASVVKHNTPPRTVPLRASVLEWLARREQQSGLVFEMEVAREGRQRRCCGVKHPSGTEACPLCNEAMGMWSEGGGPVDIANWRKRVFHPAQDRAEVKRRRPYDTRHTFATWALRAGMSTYTLARAMGTSMAMIDRTYGHDMHDADTHSRMLLDTFDSIAALPEADTATDTAGPTGNMLGSIGTSTRPSFSPDSVVKVGSK